MLPVPYRLPASTSTGHPRPEASHVPNRCPPRKPRRQKPTHPKHPWETSGTVRISAFELLCLNGCTTNYEVFPRLPCAHPTKIRSSRAACGHSTARSTVTLTVSDTALALPCPGCDPRSLMAPDSHIPDTFWCLACGQLERTGDTPRVRLVCKEDGLFGRHLVGSAVLCHPRLPPRDFSLVPSQITDGKGRCTARNGLPYVGYVCNAGFQRKDSSTHHHHSGGKAAREAARLAAPRLGSKPRRRSLSEFRP